MAQPEHASTCKRERDSSLSGIDFGVGALQLNGDADDGLRFQDRGGRRQERKDYSRRDEMIFADAGKRVIRTQGPAAGASGWPVSRSGTLNLLQTALSRLVQGDTPALSSLGADRAHRKMQFDRREKGRRMLESAAFFFATSRQCRVRRRLLVVFLSGLRPLLR